MPSSSPAHQETGVYLDAKLRYTFDYALDEESLYIGSVVLYDAEDKREVRGLLSYDPLTFTITFLANRALTPNRQYTWTFAGADDDTTLPVKKADLSPIPLTIWLDFQTGPNYSPKDQAPPLTGPLIPGVVEDGQTLADREADEFKVTDVDPVHLSSFVDVLTDEITITFSKDLKPGQAWADLITLRYTPLVRETFYFNDNQFKETIVDKIPGHVNVLSDSVAFQMPTGVWSLPAANRLKWTKDVGQPNFNANAYVRVFISGSLLDEDDKELNTVQDEEFYFLTQLFPLFTNMEAIFFRLNGLEGSLSEEVLLQHILTHSMRAYKLGCVSLTKPSRQAQRYVEAMTVMQILDDKNIQREINRGKAIRLAELSITYDFPRSIDIQATTIRREAAKDADEAKRAMLIEKGQYEFMGAIRGLNTNLVSDVYRSAIPYPPAYSYLRGTGINYYQY